MLRLIETLVARAIAARTRRQRDEWQAVTRRSFGACGASVTLRPSSTFIAPDRIRVGDNVFIGEGGWFRADGGLTIGDNTIIARNCTIFTAIHNYEGTALPYDESFITKPVTIGRNVWIGMNVNIIPGVTIGDGAIIGLATVVTHDVPARAIVGGQAFRILGYRDEKSYADLDAARSYYRLNEA